MTDPVSAAAMISASVLVPVLMVFVGYVFRCNPPETDSRFAYRTERSMASSEAWESAHAVLGDLMVRTGIVAAAVSAVAMCVVMAAFPAYEVAACLALVGLGAVCAALAVLLAGRRLDAGQ